MQMDEITFYYVPGTVLNAWTFMIQAVVAPELI